MIIYAAIRMVDGEEIVHQSTARHFKQWVEEEIEKTRRLSPEWDKKNPVVRIATFQCEEI